jgi:hypothetical protein
MMKTSKKGMCADQFKALLVDIVRRHHKRPDPPLGISGRVNLSDWGWDLGRARPTPTHIAGVINRELHNGSFAYLSDDPMRDLEVSVALPLDTERMVFSVKLLPLLADLLADASGDPVRIAKIAAKWENAGKRIASALAKSQSVVKESVDASRS